MVQILILHLTCATLGKLLNFLCLSFLNWKIKDNCDILDHNSVMIK